MSKKSLKDMINQKQGNITEDDKETISKLAQKATPYKDMSKDQLLGEIIRKKNSSSSIDNKSLQEFEKYIAPMLDKKQKNKLQSIMDQLKK